MKKLILIVLFLTGSNAALFEDSNRLCDEGNMIGCFNLGIMYMKGIRGADKDHIKALEYFRKACDGGDIDGCFNAGSYFETGEDLKQNITIAVEFYTKACNGGEVYACMTLANLYRDGKEELKSDKNQAAAYYKIVCEKGYAEGCRQYDLVRQ